MDLQKIKSEAKRIRREYWGDLLLSDILVSVVSALPLIGWVVFAPVKLGKQDNYYSAIKGNPTGWQKLYSKFEKQFGSSVLLAILLALVAIVFSVALILICVLWGLLHPTVGIIFGIVLFLIAFPILCSFEVLSFQILLVNPEMKGNEAFSQAEKLIKRYIKDYLVLTYSYILDYLLVIVTCGLYAIKFAPEISTAFVLMSDSIITGAPVETKEPDKNCEEPTAPEPQAAVLICPKCGNRNTPDSVYCEKCGNKLV